MYGLGSFSFLSEWLVEANGVFLLGVMLTCFLTLTAKASVAHAVGWGLVPALVMSVKCLLNDYPKKAGCAVGGQYFNLALTSAIVYGCFYSSSAANFMKFIAVFQLLNGLFLFAMPEAGAKAWGVASCTEMDCMMLQSLAASALSFGVLVLALVQGESAVKAIGYSWIPFFVNLVHGMFISDQFEKFGINKGLGYVWLVLMACIIGGTLF
mmetsp:Transcript_34104/g.70437  ORF Transcript_34104/g.70437 Transcript_34104/m.70437 type:complete len:210 (-) Transcript_34104:81-710(-)